MLRGIVTSLLASALFAAMYYLAPHLLPLNGEQVFAWRILLTWPLTTGLLLASGQGAAAWALLRSVWRQPKRLLLILLSAALLGGQLWLFLWAPMNGLALPTSLGYFLMPLAMVAAGRYLFAERLSPWQSLAVAVAALGVGYEWWRAGSLAWTTVFVTLGFTAYFSLRRYLQTDNLTGHWLDMLLLLPAGVYFLLRPDAAGLSAWQLGLAQPQLYPQLPLLGLLSAAALALYMTAHRLLPMALFGMLSYVEPVLLVLVALLLGERLQAGQLPLYAAILLALAFMLLDGWLRRPTVKLQDTTPHQHP